MTESVSILKKSGKGTQYEWGYWDLNPDLRVSSGS